jgi:hypothetical protein
MELNYENLSKHYLYDKHEKAIRHKKSKRKLIPDEFGLINIYFPENKKKTRMKYDKLCWILGNMSDFPLNCKVLHRNLDDNDFRLTNLEAIDSKVYNMIQEARRNLGGSLALHPHPEDKFSYVISYLENNKNKTETISDLVPARRRFARLQLKYAKILSRWCREV